MSTVFVERFEVGGDGPRIGIKDCIDIAGRVTGVGSRAFAGQPPAAHHATVVQRLLQQGWHIVGKLTMHELAFGMSGINDWSGTPLNPQDPALIPGGSSSGAAAAVGAGLMDAALGTDTGGSIRLPAACCGVFGFKPTYGRVSRTGLLPAASSLDCVGPLARDMHTLTRVMETIDPGFRRVSVPGKGHVGLVTTASAPAIVEAVHDALLRAGWRVDAVELPSMAMAFKAAMDIISAETWAAFGHLTGRGQLGDDVEARLAQARGVSAEAVAQAEDVRRAFMEEVESAVRAFDALVLPALPRLPPSLASVRAGEPILDLSAWVRPFNLSGHPALSVPVPLRDGGLKVGLQIVGALGGDARVCALGSALARHL